MLCVACSLTFNSSLLSLLLVTMDLYKHVGFSVIPSRFVFVTDSEMYSDLRKCEEDKFDILLPSDLNADIASCMDENLPVSLEQFYEINRLIDAEMESSDSHRLLFDPDMTDSEVVCVDKKSESSSDDGIDVGNIPDHQYTVNDSSSATDPYSSDSEIASLEYEELYEEEAVAAEHCASTISCRELQELISGSCGQSVVEFDPSEDVETETSYQSCRQRRVTPLANSRRLRKKEQNKTAALRYRLKKRSEQGLVRTEYVTLERRNIELRTRLDAMTKEVSYLKSLIDELCP